MSDRDLAHHDDRARHARPRGRELSDVRPLHQHGGAVHASATAARRCSTPIYAKLAGVPVALIGLIGYVMILGSLLAPPARNDPACHDGVHA